MNGLLHCLRTTSTPSLLLAFFESIRYSHLTSCDLHPSHGNSPSMTSFADTVRFCFPASSSASKPDLPTYNQPDDPDLARGNMKMTITSLLRSYAPDWGLVLVLW